MEARTFTPGEPSHPAPRSTLAHRAVRAQDFSDLVAAKAAQQKRKAAERKEATKGKKSKETFKF